MKVRDLYLKYKDLIPYAIFGILSTIINIIAYWLFAHLFGIETMAATIFAWVVTVLFVYVTNRKWVFHSEAKTAKEIIKEILSFFSCRLGTELIDIGCMFVFVTLLSWNDLLVKIFANVIVIIVNYLASKFLIFKHSNCDK